MVLGAYAVCLGAAFPIITGSLNCTTGSITATFHVQMNQPVSLKERDDDGPVRFRVVRGNPGLVRFASEGPPSIPKEATGEPLCEIRSITDFPQYDPPMRYPGVLNIVKCGECDECPSGTTWAPIYVKTTVLTAIGTTNDNSEEPYDV